MRRRQRGQALVEFAVVLPVFLALVMGVLDLGRAVWASNALGAAAREATRFAVVHGGTSSCPVGPPATGIDVPAASADCPYPSPSKEAIRERGRSAVAALGADVVVRVCYGDGCSGDTDTAGAGNGRGTPVTVVVESRVDLVVPALLGWRSFQLSGRSTMLVNH